jgi:hypothetical protein
LIVRVLALVVLAAVVLAGYTGYQALQVKDGLETVSSEVQPAVTDLQNGDAAALRDRLTTVQDGAAKAADNSKGPGWWIGGRLPRYGDDVQAIQTVADVGDVIASGVLPQVARATAKVRSIDVSDGPQAVDELKAAGKALDRADRRLRRQEARINAIDTAELEPQLARPIKQLQDALATASDFLDSRRGQAQQALASVPSMP